MGDGTRLTYALAGTDGDYFAINRVTGQITVKKPVNFEAEKPPRLNSAPPRMHVLSPSLPPATSATARLRATMTFTITINVTNVNEPPAYPQTATRYVVENTTVTDDDKKTGKSVVADTDGKTTVPCKRQ